MPHISRKRLPPKIFCQILNSLVYALATTKNKEEMARFLDSFLSETERIMLAKRLAIAYLLEEEVGESQIAETLNVTRSTVDRMKLWYESKGTGYQVAIRKLKKEKLLKEIKILALKTASQFAHYASGKIYTKTSP